MAIKAGLFDSVRRKAFERGNEAEHVLRDYGILSDEEIESVLGRLKDAAKRISDEPRISRLAHDTSLNDFLTGDKRFKTQFERKRSSGTYNPEMRAKFENRLFGTQPNKYHREGAIYGLMYNPEDVALAKDWDYKYGDNVIKLKPKTKYRATFTLGDSLGDRGQTTPVPFNEPNLALISNPENIRYSLGADEYHLQRRLEELNKGKEFDDLYGSDIAPLADEAEYIKSIFINDGLGGNPNKREELKAEWEDKIKEHRESLFNKLEELENQKVRSNAPYIETQIFGDVTPADVESIYTPKKRKLPEAWKQVADEYGIRFEGPKGCYYNCKE